MPFLGSAGATCPVCGSLPRVLRLPKEPLLPSPSTSSWFPFASGIPRYLYSQERNYWKLGLDVHQVLKHIFAKGLNTYFFHEIAQIGQSGVQLASLVSRWESCGLLLAPALVRLFSNCSPPTESIPWMVQKRKVGLFSWLLSGIQMSS